MRRDDELTREGDDPYGALASMGGVFSTVRDLARWVAGFIDAFPARDDPEGGHPLRRSSRREMQQVQRSIPPFLPARPAHEAPVAIVGWATGSGSSSVSDTELGTVDPHSGGYPGFGAHMTWHPATGLGLIGLGNLRYAPCRPVVDEQLRVLVLADAVPRRRVLPVADVRAFRPIDRRACSASWDDAVADEAFAMNMDLDEPRELRRAAVEKVAADLGPFRPDATRPEASESPAHLTWWLRGERGWVRLVLLVTPEPSPRIQRFAVTAVPDPSDALARRRRRGSSPPPGRRRPRGRPTSWPAPDLDLRRRSNARCGPPARGSGRCAAACRRPATARRPRPSRSTATTAARS